MKNAQNLIMLLLSLAVIGLFLFRVPSDIEQENAALQSTLDVMQQTLDFYERLPTDQPTFTPIPLDAAPNPTPSQPSVVPQTVPTSVSGVAAPPGATPGIGVSTPLPAAQPPAAQSGAAQTTVGPRVVTIDTTNQVDTNSGCAISPRTTFTPSESVYAVANLADMQAGDQLSVRFDYTTGGGTIYEDGFTVQEPGSFCRWYVVEPDAAGWGAGTYTVTYTVNNNPPVEATYNIQGNAAPAQNLPDGSGADTLSDEEMMDDTAP